MTIMKNNEMTYEMALDVLREYQEWRRYDGPMPDSPPQPNPFIVGMAIDVAIALLASHTNKTDKEYYGG